MNKEEIESIEIQKRQVFGNTNNFKLESPCAIGQGILSDSKIRLITEDVSLNAEPPVFFVPASGSGSRMFDFLYDFLETGVESDQVNVFFNRLSQFPFAHLLDEDTPVNKEKRRETVNFILSEEGLAYGDLPKGLIPFHNNDGKVSNPFQDQYRQALDLLGESGRIHFTVQHNYIDAIKASLLSAGANSNNFSFSFQSKDSDAFCFDAQQEVVKNGGVFLRRPSGHGALLENLNAIDSNEVLIKNIDNIQPWGKHGISNDYWILSLKILQKFKVELSELINSFSTDNLRDLNNRYEFLHESELQHITADDVAHFSNRPTRVCGMVRNTGKPGGGPFWMADPSGVSKQIVERSQVSQEEEQVAIFNSGTHFNPVFIAVSKTDVCGNLLDLNDFVDETKFFTVEKMNEGKAIKYRELPGLWNGSMSDWNTIFMEVPEGVFTPVKTVLDLLEYPHIS